MLEQIGCRFVHNNISLKIVAYGVIDQKSTAFCANGARNGRRHYIRMR